MPWGANVIGEMMRPKGRKTRMLAGQRIRGITQTRRAESCLGGGTFWVTTQSPAVRKIVTGVGHHPHLRGGPLLCFETAVDLKTRSSKQLCSVLQGLWLCLVVFQKGVSMSHHPEAQVPGHTFSRGRLGAKVDSWSPPDGEAVGAGAGQDD